MKLNVKLLILRKSNTLEVELLPDGHLKPSIEFDSQISPQLLVVKLDR